MVYRNFKVLRRGRSTDEVIAFVVSDATDEDIQNRPPAAEFPISGLHDKNLQYQRALNYCKYLNKLVEAAEQAYQQNHLVDVLTRDY